MAKDNALVPEIEILPPICEVGRAELVIGPGESPDYDDESLDQIDAIGSLECVPWFQAVDTMKAWVAKLKPGGRFRVAVPNFRAIAQGYLRGDAFHVQAAVAGPDAENSHRSQYDEESLADLMVRAGLVQIDHWHRDANPLMLAMQGLRSVSDAMPAGRVQAILSCPRFGPTLHANNAFNAFAPLQIPYHMHDGAYWHCVLSNLMEEFLESHEYIITCDYDTAFRGAHVLDLFRLMEAVPKADAICGLQMKRMGGMALFTLIDEHTGEMRPHMSRADLDRNLLRIHSGHFGLTILRTSSLKQLPRPWMVGRTNDDGKWDDGKLEPDVEFWLNWRTAGLRLYLAPKVVLGHMEEMISLPDEKLKPVYVTPGEWQKNELPEGVLHG